MALSSLAKLQTARVVLLVFCIADVLTSTAVVFVRIDSGHLERVNITKQVGHFNFGISLFDLWLLALLRAAIFTSLVLAFCWNKKKVLRKVKTFSLLCTSLLVLCFCYGVAKLLASFEFYADGSHVHGHTNTTSTNSTSPDSGHNHTRHPYHPWLWGMLGWVALAIAVYAGAYSCIASLPLSLTKISERQRNGGSLQPSESTPLLSNATLHNNNDSGGRQTQKEKATSMSSIKIMWRLILFAKPDAHLYTLGFTFLVIGACAMSFIPYYTGQVINHIAIKPSMRKFEEAILVMSVITVVSGVSAGLRGGIMTFVYSRMMIRIRKTLFQALTRQEIGFFDVNETGELTSRLTADTTKMTDQISLNLNVFLRNLVQCIGSIVFMVQLTWKLTIVTVTGIPLITIITWYFGDYYKNVQKDIQESVAKANNVAEETLSSMRTVRSFANEDIEVENYTAKLRLTLRLYYRLAAIYSSWIMTNNVLELALQVVTLYYGGHLVIFNEITGGELVSFLLYQVSLAAAIDTMGSMVTGLMQAVGAAEKVLALIDRKPKIDHLGGGFKSENMEGRIEFKNICFSYPSRPDTPVLRDVSFTAHPGEIIALVGPSGGGKSSCISLLERFYEPCSGTVLLDGKPLSVYDHSYLHTKVSLVSQEPVLFAGSISENIACGKKDVPSEQIEGAARLANAHGFISGLKDGYQTQTGEKGIQLSGGQKQRVAIARAIIRNPVVLLLDEATSALDTESEHLVQQALNRTLQGRTVIVIAHRLSTIENADRIIVINKGQVMEEGTHQELLKDAEGMYAKLVRKQMLIETEVPVGGSGMDCGVVSVQSGHGSGERKKDNGKRYGLFGSISTSFT